MTAMMQRQLWRQMTRVSSTSTSSISTKIGSSSSRASSRASFASRSIPRATTPIARTTTRRTYSSQPPKGDNATVKFWPFVGIIAAGTGAYVFLVRGRAEMPAIDAPSQSTPTFSGDDVTVIFVLGGPGAGKGTQCSNLVADYGFKHLSAGDLLRAEQERPGSQFGQLIKDYIKDGLIVPMEVTVQLLENAMVETIDPSGKGETKGKPGKFLIDGFPRKMDQALKFEEAVCPAKFVLFYDCPEKEMERRLINRGKTSGRADDNAESIRKRFRTFVETSMPVVDYYEKQGRIVKVDSTPTPEEVYKNTRKQIEGRGI